jgi:hypothetical protein
MATVIPVIRRAVQGAQSVASATWTMAGADTGIAAELTDLADRSVQVSGTFGGATVAIEGSHDGTNWVGLRDQAGVVLTFTAAGIKQIMEFSLFIRAVTSGGTGSAISVIVAGRKATPLSWS